jgi:hypothetical protein
MAKVIDLREHIVNAGMAAMRAKSEKIDEERERMQARASLATAFTHALTVAYGSGLTPEDTQVVYDLAQSGICARLGLTVPR